MNKLRERYYRDEFEKIFDHEMNSFEYTLLTESDYADWLITNLFSEFKNPAPVPEWLLPALAERLNVARAIRIAMKVEP